MEIGSIWKKWDLHIHSPASYQQEYGDFESKEVWEKYIESIEQVTDVSVIGITDYFTIKGYKKVLEYQKNGRLKNKLILPNIEFRLTELLPYRSDREKNTEIHVIFSEEVDPDNIEKYFLNRLNIHDYEVNELPLTEESVHIIGQQYIDRGLVRGNPTDVGYKRISVKFDDIIDVLESNPSCFKGKYLIVLPVEDWSRIDWSSRGGIIRKNFLRTSHAIFSSNAETIRWALGKKNLSIEQFKNEFKNLKPCIHGSDAHSYEKICKPVLDRFCWIKGNSSFEGLKQIIFEPEERVFIGKSLPEKNQKSIYNLSSISFKNGLISDKLSVNELTLPLNSNLIAVIGGKGAGKTAILDLIAHCFEDRRKRKKGIVDKNSFVQRIEEKDTNLEVSITFSDEKKSVFSKKINDENVYDHSDIEYLPQNKITDYSSDSDKLHKKIREIIFSDPKVKESDIYEEIKKKEEENRNLKHILRELNTRISLLEDETRSRNEKEIERRLGLTKGKRNEIEHRIKNLPENTEKGIQEKLLKLHNEEKTESENLIQWERVKKELNSITQEFNKFNLLNQRIEKLNDYLKSIHLDLAVTILEIEKQRTEISMISNHFQDLSILNTDNMKKIRNQIGKFTGYKDKIQEIFQERHEINKKIDEIHIELNRFERRKNDLKELKSERTKNFIKFIRNVLFLRKKYGDSIEIFSRTRDKILEDIEFKSEIKIKSDIFSKNADKVLDRRKVTQNDITKIQILLEEMIKCDDADLVSITGKYMRKALEFTNKRSQSISDSDFYSWIFENYFNIHTQVFFKKIKMEDLSIGQKGTVLLLLLLVKGNNPLIIDQPEENLDNKFIYETLVWRFREAKKNRQIIIATHNANLVVNTDAEQIIIAEYLNNIIKYRAGPIENKEIREDITIILEGGEKAFKEREQKYYF